MQMNPLLRPCGLTMPKSKMAKKTYMWVYRNRNTHGTHPIVLFDWQSSRRSDHPRDFLKDFSGTVVTDGYQVYHKIANERQDLKVAGCWIHARRPFAEIVKSIDISNAKETIAQEAYDRITEILHIDNNFDDLPVNDRKNSVRLYFYKRLTLILSG